MSTLKSIVTFALGSLDLLSLNATSRLYTNPLSPTQTVLAHRLQLYQAIDQAQADADGKLPILLHGRNRKSWLAVVYLDDLAGLADVVAGAKG